MLESNKASFIKDHNMPKGNVLHSFYSEETKRFYRLVEVPGDFPCLEISGIKMHCQGSGIKRSVNAMVASLKPVQGKVLDCCFGQGYAALELSRQAGVEKVWSFEKDANVLEIARVNPSSAGVFENPKILVQNKPIEEALKEFPAGFFDAVFHDPPSIRIAGELYSQEFYNQLFKALRKGGKLFHYAGSPGKKSGKDYTKGIIERLKKAGFRKVLEVPNALGLLAVK